MAANLSDHLIMQAIQTRSGNTPFMQAIPEKSGQTFLEGVPVMLTTGGVVQLWDANVGAASPTVGIVGISRQPGANLGSGSPLIGGPPQPWGSVPQPGTTVTYGSVQYQSGAYNIPEGAPASDGRVYLESAVSDTIFIGQFDNASGSNFTVLASMLGEQFGLTQDSVGHWYVDGNKTTAGTNTVVVVVGFDPTNGVGIANGNVYFVFLPAIRQNQA